jgi:YVTN family beta-propeller protein
VTNETSNDLSVINLATQTVTARIPIGNGPRKVAVQPTGMTATASAIAP